MATIRTSIHWERAQSVRPSFRDQTVAIIEKVIFLSLDKKKKKKEKEVRLDFVSEDISLDFRNNK